MSTSSLIGLVLASGLLAAVPAFADSYVFTTIDVPGATSTTATGVNASGEIVGYYSDASGTHGFSDVNGSFATLNSPASSSLTQAWSVNNAGQIVVNSEFSGFVYSNGSYTAVTAPNPPYIDTIPYGMNNSGQVVGNVSEVINLHGNPPMGFLYSGGSFSFIHTSDQSTFAQGINDSGEVVGYSYTNPAFVGVNGFVYMNGIVSALNVSGQFGTVAYGVNNAGQVVGYYYGSAFGPNNADNGFLEINGVFSTIDVPGATSTQIFGINDAGDLVGDYSDSTGTHGFLATPAAVPEPVSLSLLAIGFVGFGAFRRIRRGQL
jgi:uncharacterized membrane protein